MEEDGVPRREKFVKIREDLQDYFEVVSHQESTLRCKLADQDNCKIANTIKFRSQRGWYNFERHLIRVHNVSPSVFGKAENFGQRQGKGNGRKRNWDQTENMDESSEPICVKSGSTEPTWTELKWANLLIKEKYCLVCQDVCQTEDDEEQFWNKLERMFPGCEGSRKLSAHLFSIFFLQSVIDFPLAECEKLLKKCRGRRTPETWFTLCFTCREVELQAVTIHHQLISLQKELQNLKKLIASKFQDQAERDSTVSFSKIEKIIRDRVLGQTTDVLSDCPPDDDDYMAEDETLDQDISDSAIKMELGLQCATTDSSSTRSRRTRIGSLKSYNESDYHDNYEGFETVDSSQSQNTSALIKIEQPDINTDTENFVYADESCNSNNGNEDDDDDYQPELSDLDPDFVMDNMKKRVTKKVVATTASTKPKRSKANNKKSKALSTRKVSHSGSGSRLLRNGSKLHLCQLCPAKYLSQRSLHEHLEAHEMSKTLDNKYDCQHCGFPCPSERAKILHVNSKHGPEGGFRCTLCNFSTPTNKLHKQHLMEHKKEAENGKVDGKYLCKMCKELFITYNVLCRHIRSVHYKEVGAVPYQCEYCDLIVSSKRLLQGNIQQIHKKQCRYFCEICGRGTLYASKLRRHMDSHLKEKKHVCHICGADFIYLEVLRKHIKKEHPEAMEQTGNHSCSENPSTHAKYTCKHCSTEFYSVTLLNRHIKSSHEELFTNKCELCGNTYATLQSLRRHKEINHSARQVPCMYCGKRFSHQECIRQHFKFCKQYPNRKEKKTLGVTSEPISVDQQSIKEQLESDHVDDFTSSLILGVSSSEYHQIHTNAI